MSKVKVTRPINDVTDNAPYLDQSITIFLNLTCFTHKFSHPVSFYLLQLAKQRHVTL